MGSRRWLPITIALLAFLLAALFSLLVNLTSTYLADTLRPYASWVYALTGLIFFASLGVLVWQLTAKKDPAALTGSAASPNTGVQMNNVHAGRDINVNVASGSIVQGSTPTLASPAVQPTPPAPNTSGAALAQQQAAILNAFNREELRRELRTCLDVDLDAIAADAPFADQVFAVLTWSVRTNRHAALLACLRRARPHLVI
jgi:hypothetical protein